jgi:Tc5 transposase DNA-binding domain
VPKSTMERHLKAPHLGYSHASGRPTVFTKASEAELATLIYDLAHRGFPLSEVQVRNLATQYANANNQHVFSEKKNNQASYYWFKGFLVCHCVYFVIPVCYVFMFIGL